MKNIHSWVQPLLIAALRSIELLECLLKHEEDAASRIAGFESNSERVREEIVLCAFLYTSKAVSELVRIRTMWK